MKPQRKELLKKWLDNLPEADLRPTLLICLKRLIEIEELGFHEESDGPYWDGSGESIVPWRSRE